MNFSLPLHLQSKSVMFLEKIYQRFLTLCVLLLAHLNSMADDPMDDDEVGISLIPTDEDEEAMDGIFFDLRPSMILMAIGAIVLLFFLNKLKVKKGCWYVIAYFVGVYFLIKKCT